MAISESSPMTCLVYSLMPRLKSSDTMHLMSIVQPEVMATESALENYFSRFRENIIGHQQTFDSPFGRKKIIYADWTASGRAYRPIEAFMQREIMPFAGNTHTHTTITGTLMSKAYE